MIKLDFEKYSKMNDLTRRLSNAFNQVTSLFTGVESRLEALENAPAPIIPSPNAKSVTSTYSVLPDDDVIILSGGSFVATLPTAVGVEGKRYTFIHNGTNLTQTYIIRCQSGQFINTIISDYELFTNLECVKIVSNGAGWTTTYHYAETPWISAGTTTITATGSNPTKASAIVEDVQYWKRKGDEVRFIMRLKQGATTGSAAGSGTYIFTLPSGLNIKTSLTNTAVLTGTAIQSGALNQNLGSVVVGYVSTMRNGSLVVRDSTSFSLYVYNVGDTTLSAVRSNQFALNAGADLFYGVDVMLPIDGWQP